MTRARLATKISAVVAFALLAILVTAAGCGADGDAPTVTESASSHRPAIQISAIDLYAMATTDDPEWSTLRGQRVYVYGAFGFATSETAYLRTVDEFSGIALKGIPLSTLLLISGTYAGRNHAAVCTVGELQPFLDSDPAIRAGFDARVEELEQEAAGDGDAAARAAEQLADAALPETADTLLMHDCTDVGAHPALWNALSAPDFDGG